MGSTDYYMPSADSPDLVIVIPTDAERIECLDLNGQEWKGPLNSAQYIQRENHLINQDITRDGALTCWVLVDGTLPPDDRPILSSCESFSKAAFLAHGGHVEDILAHGVGSVFCRPEFRGRGYARRMIAELAEKLDTWQHEKTARGKSVFSVLYSDIGKKFYAQFGWKAFPSSHFSLAPISKEEFGSDIAGLEGVAVRDMTGEDVKQFMCSKAVINKYREILREASKCSKTSKVALSPDFEHMSWHWAREEFYSQALLPERGVPNIKGACVEDCRVFVTWNRNFGNKKNENTLYILRCLYDEPTSPSEEKPIVKALAGVLFRAQLEAHEWDMDHVEIWNPTPLIEKAVKLLSPDTEMVHREKSSICSLKWNGASLGLGDEVDWFWNEKYAWC
ncbi:hypothetical protein AJ80_08871 [Polytolypa hystricis UAMH7299]|uniref:LYC1 C-terminal domain-containing protein n=1 Tax=Polytolypa hystricis (strain UAMH7299) TaxID=1447883 RepID=A0A2B7X0D6_POLH7|nr:hypothetical protein AJ80_08871 [Polytolypa hystricis UAMH7299]